jgi:hypothetical protein
MVARLTGLPVDSGDGETLDGIADSDGEVFTATVWLWHAATRTQTTPMPRLIDLRMPL